MADNDKNKKGFNQKAKKEALNERKTRGQITNKSTMNTKPPKVFSQKANKESLDQFIRRVLSNKQIDDVEILDLSRHKINELSDKVKFYMRMLRKVRTLNLYANKLRVVPVELGKYFKALQKICNDKLNINVFFFVL